MMKNLSLVLMLLFLSSCAAKSPKKAAQAAAEKAPSPARTEYIKNVSFSSSISPAKGKTASDFSWYNAAGQRVSLASFKGKTVLINFWATWCGPCKAELPDIEAISRQYAHKGLVVIGVSEDTGPGVLKHVAGFVKQHGLTYQIVIDSVNISNAYGFISAIPTSFIVNKDGKIVDKWVGERGKGYFEATVRKFLD